MVDTFYAVMHEIPTSKHILHFLGFTSLCKALCSTERKNLSFCRKQKYKLFKKFLSAKTPNKQKDCLLLKEAVLAKILSFSPKFLGKFWHNLVKFWPNLGNKTPFLTKGQKAHQKQKSGRNAFSVDHWTLYIRSYLLVIF